MLGLAVATAFSLVAVSWDLSGLMNRDMLEKTAAVCEDSIASEREECVNRGLRELLGEKGYFEAAIETTEVDGERTLVMVPGRQYRLGRLVVDGVHASAVMNARRSLMAMEGRPWDATELTRRLTQLLAAYEDNGYPFASLSVRHVSVDEANASLGARLGVREGPKTIIESVRVSPGAKTKPRIAARLAGLREGTLYRQFVLDAADERLRKTGYFSAVSQPRLVAGSGPGNVVVELVIEERPTHHLNGAIGLSQDGELAGSFDLNLRNIAGTAREAHFSWESSGSGRSDLFLAYTEPWVLGLPPALTVEVRQAVEDTLWVERSGRVGLSWDLGRGFTGALGYSTRRVIPGEQVVAIPATRTDEGWGQADWDRVTRLGLWERGYRFRLWTAYRQREDLETGEEIPVVPLELDAVRHLLLGRNTLLGIFAGWRQLISAQDRVPLPEQYPLGGALTVRGYREKQFRSKTTGWLSIELRLVPDQKTSLFVFVDGGIYRQDDSWEYLLGFGPGIRVDTALGVMELDYGIPDGAGLLDGRIHLSLGRAF